jgi:NADH pyrophosphatase NudC (nudix superfamily)
MSAVGTHVALAAALTAVAGVLMSRIGQATGMIKERATRRFCPCCGRRLSRRGCEHCGF